MGINKVQYGNTTLIDLTADTVTADVLLEGYTAHDRSGAIITGTAHEGGDVPVWQGADDYVYLSDTVTPPYEIVMVDGYVVIDLPPAVLQTKTRTYTPTTSQQTDVITADNGYDGLEEVDITVNAIQTETKSATPSESAQTITPTSGKYLTSVSVGAIDSNYVGTGVTRQSAKTVTPTESSQTAVASGVYTTGAVTVGAISSTYVGSGITQRSSSDLTASGATVTVPSGYYSAQATKSVATGTAGTPTATKGAVSNHSVSVTPSVTNTGGYIDGGTKTGTAVSVSASELVSGNLSITENGTGINVANYSTVSVEVSGGGGLEYETGTWTTDTDVTDAEVTFAKTHTDPPFFACIYDASGTYDATTNSVHMYQYNNFHMLGFVQYPSSTSTHYARRATVIRSTSTTSFTDGTGAYTLTSGIPVYNDGFTARYGSSTYFRANRTYKWIAVWAPTT